MSNASRTRHPGFFSLENLRSLGLLLLAVFALRWSVASPYHVPTASMEPSIRIGDRLLAFKLAYSATLPFTDIKIAEWASPKRGDIIIFRYPRDPEIDYVKRVVAIGGDEVQIVDDVLFINGQAQERAPAQLPPELVDANDDAMENKDAFIENLAGREHFVLQNKGGTKRLTRSSWPPPGTGPYRVPSNAVFCIGDNRDNSTDSRVWSHVPLDYVRGKALFVIWSIYNPRDGSWPRFRFHRFGHALH